MSIVDVIFDVAEKLDSAHIPFMISGSIAANLYGEPRFTNDVDFVIQIQKVQTAILLSLFQKEYYITQQAIDDAFAGLGMLNIIHNASLVKCDLIILKHDEFSDKSFQRRTQLLLEGKLLPFISLEDLILRKLLWRRETGSELQLHDILRLISANKVTMDMQYCRKWAQQLGLLEELKKVL